MIKKSGSFEDIDIVFCVKCTKRNILPAKFVDTIEEFLTAEVFTCKECFHVDEKAVWNCGKRFTCPDCNKENIQVIEASNSEKIGDLVYKTYTPADLVCLYCESSFRMGIIVKGDFTPDENVLYKETDD
jgi:hypothetical protein